jgi:hypothetical protein
MHAQPYATYRRDDAGRMSQRASTDTDTSAPSVVWDHVIRALRGSLEIHAPAPERRPRRADAQAASCNAQIKVLERLTPRSITVLWQDATRCRYADQVWNLCRARATGRCAITGAAIGRDDYVYRPRSRSASPGNARAMILASTVDALPAFDAGHTVSGNASAHVALTV